MIQDLLNWVQELGPWGIFSFLVLCSFGLPIAKSLLLLLAGMLAHQMPDRSVAYFAAAILGLHCGDFALYSIGFAMDENLFHLPIVRKIFKQKTIDHVRKLIDEHGFFSLVIARLTPYIRGVCYLMLGSLRMSALKFTLINLLICLFYSLFFFIPGYFLVSQLENLRKLSQFGNQLLIGIFLLILIALFVRLKWKKRKSIS